jgi:hypothetical protein
MRIKFISLLCFVTAISLTFAFGIFAPHRTLPPSGTMRQAQGNALHLSLVESTLIPAKVALLEPLTLNLDSPLSVHLGDITAIRLTVTIDARGNVSVATNDSAATPVADVSDVFDSYNVIVETRLDLPRLYTAPAELVSQPILVGQSITFTWTVRADAVGEYEGTVWFFLRFVPKGDNPESGEQVTGPGSELAVAAIPFELRVISLLGIKGSTARVIGTVGLFVSILIALPLLLDRLFRSKS